MERFFNTSGPVVAADHYLIPPLSRVDWDELQHLMRSKRYFVLHAPRQTGKTSALLAMMETLNREGDYKALYVNIEAAQAVRNDAESGLALICETIANRARIHRVEPDLTELVKSILAEQQARGALTQLLTRWAEASEQPIILMLDEVDALIGDTLISLLRQIRAGYDQRPAAFPQTIILCGVRDVRDYRIHTAHHEIITGGSAFNIKAKSLTLSNFSRDQVQRLFQQHTEATGQAFAKAVFPELWADTRGQPWLVNALAYELTWETRMLRDRSVPITLEHYHAARERLIQSRATHLDQLTDKLKEPRVHSVIEPILKGDSSEQALNPEDVLYVQDLGLITQAPNGAIEIANRIYQEVIPRELAWSSQIALTQNTAWYLTSHHRLDMPKLLTAFQQFFREHSDIWLQGLPYKEAGPQLLLQAFLQRIVNGGGRIHREYALGRKRTDLLIEWPEDEAQGFYGPVQRIVIELKILRGKLDTIIETSVQQTLDYAQRVGADERHLIIFNRNPEFSWDDKIWHRTDTCDDLAVEVWGA